MPSVAQIQNALDPQGTGNRINILKHTPISGAELYQVQGVNEYPGRVRTIQVATSRTAAQAASDILAGLAREY